MRYWWIAIIAIIVVSFFIRVPYHSFPATSTSLFCEEGVLKQRVSNSLLDQALGPSYLTDIEQVSDGLTCSIMANGKLDVTFGTKCINNQPTIVCRTQLYNAILMGKLKFISFDTQDKTKKMSEEQVLEICRSECLKQFKVPTWQTVDWDACERGVYSCTCEENQMSSTLYGLSIDIYSGEVIEDPRKAIALQESRGKRDPKDKCWG